MDYNLELERAIGAIKQEKAKLVLIQLPEGLKAQGTTIASTLEKETKSKVIIWMGSNWGACDTPVGIEHLGFDLLIQWGHSSWPGFLKRLNIN